MGLTLLQVILVFIPVIGPFLAFGVGAATLGADLEDALDRYTFAQASHQREKGIVGVKAPGTFEWAMLAVQAALTLADLRAGWKAMKEPLPGARIESEAPAGRPEGEGHPGEGGAPHERGKVSEKVLEPEEPKLTKESRGEPVATEEPKTTERAPAQEKATLDESGLVDELPGEVTPENLEMARGLCFPAGTLVSTPAGIVQIDALKPGDLVYAFDFTSQAVVTSHVLEVTRSYTGSWVDVHLGSGLLRATLSHPIWVESQRDWIAASSLTSGMRLRLQTGRLAEVTDTVIRPLPERQASYNLHIEKFHTFFAGEGELRILVHNGKIPERYLRRLMRKGYRNYILFEKATEEVYYSGMFGPTDNQQHVVYRHSQNNDRFNPKTDDIRVEPGTRTYGEARWREHQNAIKYKTIKGRDPNTYRNNRQDPIQEKKLPVYEEYVKGVKSGRCD
jgi:hypothetical protein